MTHEDSPYAFTSCSWSHSEDPDMCFIRLQCRRVLPIGDALLCLKCHRTKYSFAFRCYIDGRHSVPTGDVRSTSSEGEPLFVFGRSKRLPRRNGDLSCVDVLLRANSSYLDHNTTLQIVQENHVPCLVLEDVLKSSSDLSLEMSPVLPKLCLGRRREAPGRPTTSSCYSKNQDIEVNENDSELNSTLRRTSLRPL